MRKNFGAKPMCYPMPVYIIGTYNADGTPNTAHSLNPVPIVVVSDRVASVKDGILADVAPTVLDLMGLPKPAEMTGESLVSFK